MDNQVQKQQFANPATRVVGWFIDLMVWLLLILIFIYLVVSQNQLNMLMDNILTSFVALFLLLPLLVPFINSFIITIFGGSIGNLLTLTRIVDSRGNNISYWRAFFRNYLGYMVSAVLFWLGFIWVFIDKERRSWHDMMADTWVVARNKSGIFVGLIALVFIIIVNSLLVSSIFTKAYQNRLFYKDTVDEVIEEFNNFDAAPTELDGDLQDIDNQADLERNPFMPSEL